MLYIRGRLNEAEKSSIKIREKMIRKNDEFKFDTKISFIAKSDWLGSKFAPSIRIFVSLPWSQLWTSYLCQRCAACKRPIYETISRVCQSSLLLLDMNIFIFRSLRLIIVYIVNVVIFKIIIIRILSLSTKFPFDFVNRDEKQGSRFDVSKYISKRKLLQLPIERCGVPFYQCNFRGCARIQWSFENNSIRNDFTVI